MENIEVKSDIAWYCRKDAEEERYYDIFFGFCRKYNINWANASEKEQYFIEEITRVTYEKDRALRLGLSEEGVRPAFAS